MELLENKGCEHCNFIFHTTDTDYGTPLGLDGANDSIVIETNGIDYAISSDSWEIDISFCPKCGRCLTQHDEKGSS